ncbi:sacsin N-terminal ATP-binding-like domain-containing protein [Haloplanus aerogenes]|uniref:Sacsin/Nov domain-containing protein n=1 Tax=Haloplanus aerogenes TaxID=660522 RepID=A0A3M0DTT5_9EURY|nr:hypothetical protein [Haloplanus aerogenes]AZH25621.1 hypothetical protein DU502_09600 [Haloplanus aerogenes]RMB25342.1 hypothetical protein ATH50_0429 [Haloplanus aerogenes]
MKVSGESEATCVRDLRESRLNTYREMPNDILSHYTDEGENEENYYGRFAYELIQNADDAVGKVDGENPRTARFELQTGDDPYLIVANSGMPVDADDTRALTAIGDTTKRDAERKATIGHKGRGFSAVLEITEQPYVFSTDVSFMFDRERSRECISEVIAEVDEWSMDDLPGIPLMRLPFAPDQYPERVETLLTGEYETVFYFPLRTDAVTSVRQSLEDLDAQTVLFLQNLGRLEIAIDGSATAWDVARHETAIDAVNSTVDLVKIQRTAEQTDNRTYLRFARNELPLGEHTAGISNNTWGEVTETQVSVALRAERREDGLHLRPVAGDPYAHVFLPTEERSPVPVLINGAFDSNLSRTAIELTNREMDYNRFLIREAANILASDAAAVARNTATTASELLSCIDFTAWADPATREEHTFRDELIRAIQAEFAEVSCVPLAGRDSESVYVAPEDILLPSHLAQAREALVDFVAHWDGSPVDVADGDVYGYFPAASLLSKEHNHVPAVLHTLGATELSVVHLPELIPQLPETWRDIDRYPPGPQRTATDPVVELLTAVWLQLDDDEQERFRVNARNHPLVPVSVSTDGGTVTRVCAAETELYIPPEDSELPVEIPSVEFVLEYVYRPRGRLGNQALPQAVQQRQNVIKQVWRPDSFQFEELVRTTVTPRVTETEPTERNAELEIRLLGVLEELGRETATPDAPLPLQDRYESQPLYRLCQVRVPTQNYGLCPAYRVYFGKEWAAELESSSVQGVFEAADIDAPLLVGPDELENRLAAAGFEWDEGLNSDAWKEFLQWLGVSPHLRLQSFFAPDEQRQFSETVAEGGVARPQNGASVLGELDEDEWDRYQTHLEAALDEMDAGRQKYDSIYAVNGFEYWPELRQAARDETTQTPVGEAVLNHLIEWWDPIFNEYREATLATHSVSGFGGRNSSSQSDGEFREVGTNLWLWQLQTSRWCPSTRGTVTPANAWDPPGAQANPFELGGQSLLPILRRDHDPAVYEAQPFLEELGIRQHLSAETFTPKDARTVCDGVVDVCTSGDVDIADSLRDIQPVYRQIQDLAPPVDEDVPDESPWTDARQELEDTELLCRVGDSFEFRAAGTVYFARSPSVRADYPFDQLPFFVLEEQRAARIGEYFGLTDFTAVITVDGEPIDERAGRTTTLVEHVSECAPAILCRLEAERPSQRLIDQDLTRMEAFLDRVTVVDEIEVTYTLNPIDADEVLEETTTTPFYLQSQYRGSVEERYPYIAYREHEREQWQLVARALCAYLDVTQFEGIDALLSASSTEERRRYLQYANAPAGSHALAHKRQRLHNDEETERRQFGTPSPMNHSTSDEVNEDAGGLEEDTESTSADATGDDDPEPSTEQSSTTRLYDAAELRVGNETISVEPTPTTDSEDEETSDLDEIDDVVSGKDERVLTETASSSRTRDQSTYDVEDLGVALAEAWEATRLRRDYDCSNPQEYVFRVDERHLVEEARQGNAATALQQLEENAGIPEHFPGFDLLTVNPETGEADRLIELKAATCRRRKPSVSWNEWTTARNEWVQQRDTPLYYLYVIGHLSKTTNPDPYIRTIANPFRLLDAQVEHDVSVTRSIQVDIDAFSKAGVDGVADPDPVVEIPVETETDIDE